MQLSRRDFLKRAGATGALLVIGLNAEGLLAAGTPSHVINPFIQIDTDGTVTVIIKHFEMGQGTTTGLSTLVAEELDADWDGLKVEFAPADAEKYKNLFWGAQGTGGSTAIANAFLQYRSAGASARDLLVRAAAQQWQISAEKVTVSKGRITAPGKSGHFGQFVEKALTLTPSENPTLKSPDQFTLIGKLKLPRKDSISKTNGTAQFALDVTLPNMVYATIKRPPKFGGAVKSFNAEAAKKVPGFINALALPNNAGVVVYAKNTWASMQARKALEVIWDFSAAETRSSE